MSTCPPCNQKCNQGRDCPANKQRTEKQKPVAHVYRIELNGRPAIAWDDANGIEIGTALYTAPPKREWVGLTEPELHEINPTWPAPGQHWDYEDVLAFARAIEAKLKDKNT